MLARWLATPAARRWWGEPAHELAMLREDLDEPAITMLIVSLDGTPFAFLQHFAVHTWPVPQYAHLPTGSRALDTFIGDATMIGRGHGSAFVRQFALWLRARGVPAIALDPDITNYRARRAYSRAGFVPERLARGSGRPAAVMLFAD